MKHIDYKTFNSVQAIGQNPTEDRYNVLQEKVAQMLKDEPISILLTMIVLFGQDFCVLQQKKHVQKQQETYIVLLQKYISSQLPARKACAKFAACMEVVTNLREMVDIKKIRNVSINVRIWEMFWNVYFVFLYVIWTSIFFFFPSTSLMKR